MSTDTSLGVQAALRPVALAAGAVGFATHGDAADVLLAVISAATPGPPSAPS